MSSRAVVGLVIVAGLAFAAEARADERHDLGGLTFALPASWKFEHPAGSDHARLTFADAKRYCIVSLYEARAASPDLGAELLREWRSVAGSIKDRTPKAAARKLGGRALLEATGEMTAPDQTKVFERVAVIDGGGQIATMVVLAATAATERACQPDADAIVASLQFPAGASAAPQPAPAAPANGLAGTLKPTITANDLAGKWFKGAGVVTYRDTSSGAAPGSSAAVAGMSYVFTANGTYEYAESGRNGSHSFSNTETGKIAIVGGNLVLTSKTGRLQRLQLLAFMTLPDGAAVLTVNDLGIDGPPMPPDRIAAMCGPKDGVFQCRYSDQWSRLAPTHK